MAVANPPVLLVMEETAGVTITNYGDNGFDYTIEQGTEGIDYSWHPSAVPVESYFEGLQTGGSGMPWADTAAPSIASGLYPISVAFSFRLDALGDGGGTIVLSSADAVFMGDVNLFMDGPTSTGDFDLHVLYSNSGGGTLDEVFEDLSFGVVYRVAASFDVTVPTACVATTVLDNGTPRVQMANFDTLGFFGAFPLLFRRSDFNDFFGFDGRCYYIAYDNEVAWTEAELVAINADPPTGIDGWPGGTGTVTGSGALVAGAELLAGEGQIGPRIIINGSVSGGSIVGGSIVGGPIDG